MPVKRLARASRLWTGESGDTTTREHPAALLNHNPFPPLPWPLRRPSRLVGSVVWTAGIIGAYELYERLLAEQDRELALDRWFRRWAKTLLEISHVDLTVIPGPPAHATRARLVVSNHRSALDIPVLLSQFGGSPLSRADIETWPLLGYGARRVHTVFVEQESAGSAIRALRAIRQQLQAGRTVSVFPEGNTFPGDEVREFLAGAFAAARGLDVEVVPVGLAYPPGTEYVEDTFAAHADAVAQRKRTPVVMAVGASVSSRKDASGLAEEMQHAVQALVVQARRVAEDRA